MRRNGRLQSGMGRQRHVYLRRIRKDVKRGCEKEMDEVGSDTR